MLNADFLVLKVNEKRYKLRFIIAKHIYFFVYLRYHGTMEMVPMINRPLYVDKIMAYTDTPFVKVLTGGSPLRKIHSSKNDHGEAATGAWHSV